VQQQQEQIEQQQNEIQELKEANASLNESIYEIKAHLNLQTKKD
jgi:cell division protein FtsB